MRNYLVIYEWAETNWSAYVPDLPGCVACADTREETELLMREAIELYLEALEETGKAPPAARTRAGLVEVG